MFQVRRTTSRRGTAWLVVVAMLCASDARLTLVAKGSTPATTAEGLLPRCVDEGGDCCSPLKKGGSTARCDCCAKAPDVPRDRGDSRPLAQPPGGKVVVDLVGLSSTPLFDGVEARPLASLAAPSPVMPPPLVFLSNHLRC